MQPFFSCQNKRLSRIYFAYLYLFISPITFPGVEISEGRQKYFARKFEINNAGWNAIYHCKGLLFVNFFHMCILVLGCCVRKCKEYNVFIDYIMDFDCSESESGTSWEIQNFSAHFIHLIETHRQQASVRVAGETSN